MPIITAGAIGQTRTELETLLGAEGEDRTGAMSALQAALNEYGGDPVDATGEVLPEVPIAHTGGLIESSAIEPDPDLYLALQNAVLFAAQWEQMFPDHRTSDRTFRIGSGEQVQVPTMSNTGDLAHAQVAGHRDRPAAVPRARRRSARLTAVAPSGGSGGRRRRGRGC